MDVQDLIRRLKLQPHPEGGFYRETYRSNQSLVNNQGQNRNVSTAIFYLLQDNYKSAFHRILSDELWFFHQGLTVEIVIIQDGQLTSVLLGNDFEKGEIPQAIIPANTWFAAKIKNRTGYSLISCTVAPGFDFADFELAEKEKLLQQFPHLKDAIEEYSK
ncbi:cupin domain-containing protein [Adhaeribacter radiodurans]|uniref:Cupin domain-containing protein n=1 Tax=Adhaeribacter radiodurans TaxID=2745197 RepID=A0A7L7LA45_9BACT|nr:cupin domain-containing protein [Adhaeribacter radiodurans]QMU29716.1 cupin domain-containing protein [Adhaeribacter radiodurans]